MDNDGLDELKCGDVPLPATNTSSVKPHQKRTHRVKKEEDPPPPPVRPAAFGSHTCSPPTSPQDVCQASHQQLHTPDGSSKYRVAGPSGSVQHKVPIRPSAVTSYTLPTPLPYRGQTKAATSASPNGSDTPPPPIRNAAFGSLTCSQPTSPQDVCQASHQQPRQPGAELDSEDAGENHSKVIHLLEMICLEIQSVKARLDRMEKHLAEKFANNIMLEEHVEDLEEQMKLLKSSKANETFN